MLIKMESASGGGTSGVYLDVVPTGTLAEVADVGFAPKHILVYFEYTTSTVLVLDYDVENNHIYKSYGASYFRWNGDEYINDYIKVVGTKLYLRQLSNNASATNYVYIV